MKINQQFNLGEEQTAQVQRIYVASFPASERLDFAEIVASIKKRKRLIFTAEDEQIVVGFAILTPLSCTNTYLLEYMAVTHKKRSLGVGSALLQNVVKSLRCEESPSGILLEVEPITDAPAAELDTRKKRISFYLKNGAHIVEQIPSYCMPNLAGDGGLPMKLMWLPLNEAKTMISRQTLRDCIISIYANSYGRPENDTLLQSILQDLEFQPDKSRKG